MAPGIPAEVESWLDKAGWGTVVNSTAVGGGCIHNGRRLLTSSGRTAFLKTNHRVPSDLFSREAAGLQALAAPGSLRIPAVFAAGETFLLLEDLAPAPPARDYWERLGRGLAELHRVERPGFGFEHDNYLGSTPQPNPEVQDGYVFFAEHRLAYQAGMAVRAGLFERTDAQRIEKLGLNLRELIPEQPASLIHGDLWSGNLLADSEGAPALIDPAAHFGWREADLAMMVLFGSVPEAFYAAYREVTPLPEGLRARFPIYNLYHLLNHVNLFGRGYLGQVLKILDRYV